MSTFNIVNSIHIRRIPNYSPRVLNPLILQVKKMNRNVIVPHHPPKIIYLVKDKQRLNSDYLPCSFSVLHLKVGK